MQMNWNKVADRLLDEAAGIRSNAMGAFPNDFETQKEMRTRACLLEAFGFAIKAGIEVEAPKVVPR